MRRFLALAVLSVTLPALAADYPTKPDEMDKLCEVIGEAPNLSVPPKDRLWFKENCTCAGRAGCGNISSDRFRQRLAAATAAREAQEKKDEEARQAKEAKATAARAAHTAQRPLRLAYWKCVNAIIPGVTPPPPAGQRACEKEIVALEKACGRKMAWSTCTALDKSEREALEDAEVRANPDKACPHLRYREQNNIGEPGQATKLFAKYCTRWEVEEAARVAAEEAQRQVEQKRQEEEQKRQMAERQARDIQLMQAAEPLRAAYFGCLKTPGRGRGACGMEAESLNATCQKLSTSALTNECLSE